MEQPIEIDRDDAAFAVFPARASEAPDGRIPYTPPMLAVYGSASVLTATVGTRGKRDGRRGNRRTGF